ncbi:MAG: CAT RNA binding domain-containing protein [Clostridium sp.]
MKIEKVINNNVVSALENGREVVVMGRGIGFQLRAGMDIPGELIEKVFRLDNPGVMDRVQKPGPEASAGAASDFSRGDPVCQRRHEQKAEPQHLSYADGSHQFLRLRSLPEEDAVQAIRCFGRCGPFDPGGIPDRHVCAGLDRAKAGNYISGR